MRLLKKLEVLGQVCQGHGSYWSPWGLLGEFSSPICFFLWGLFLLPRILEQARLRVKLWSTSSLRSERARVHEDACVSTYMYICIWPCVAVHNHLRTLSIQSKKIFLRFILFVYMCTYALRGRCPQRPEEGVESLTTWMLRIKGLCSARMESILNHRTAFPGPSWTNLIRYLGLFILDHCPLDLLRKAQIPFLSGDQHPQANSNCTVTICQIMP